MALELCQYIIYKEKSKKGWWVSLALTSKPNDILTNFGPYKTAKEARIAVDELDPKADWANAKKAYSKIDYIAEDLPPWN